MDEEGVGVTRFRLIILQGEGAGWAMKVGTSSPGINTDTPLPYTVTSGDGQSSFVRTMTRLEPPEGDVSSSEEEDARRRSRSKMAMTRNIAMRMAVATKPNDTAVTELSKFLH